MAGRIDNENQSSLRQRTAVEYVFQLIVVGVLVAEIGFTTSAWFSVQTGAGLVGGIVLVGTMSSFLARTTLGQSIEETFQQRRLLTSLLAVVLVTVGGNIVSSILENPSRVFLLAFVLGVIGGMFILDRITDQGY